MNKLYWNNTPEQYLIASAIILGGLLLLRLFRKQLLTQIKKLVLHTRTSLDDLIIDGIERFGIPIFRFLVIYWGVSTLVLSQAVQKWVDLGFRVVLIFYIVRFVLTLIRTGLEAQVRKQEQGEAKIKQIGGIMVVINVTTWMIALLLLIKNLGYDVSAILTGLGIGGIAIALAAQNILGDLFNYFVIFFDRPFEVGDFILVDDKKGTVEYIGVKTTRIRSITGEQLVIANSNLTGSRIHNYKRLESRRVLFTLGVVYGTSVEMIRSIPNMIKEIIEREELTRFDRTHFSSYGDFSLNFEVVYFVDTADYNTYMDILQRINVAIYDRFLQEKVEFAFPTQTIHLPTSAERMLPNQSGTI